MSNLFRKSSNFSQNVQVKTSVETPLPFWCHRPLDVNSPSILTIPLILFSLLLKLVFILFSLVLQVRMKFMQPFAVYWEQHNWVRVSLFIVHALEFSHIHGIIALVIPKDWSCLRVDCADVNCLLHTFQSHTEQEQPSNLKSHGQINKNLSQGCYFRLIFVLGLSTFSV